ncbi:MAG: DNA primase DnaG [Candidatus Wukongarchaeota archaeon]|nr:DNA primase DnaG [Candidatus Wukongarchaeota archaeon]
MGPDLELRELQKSGRIGRIQVELKSEGGKCSGSIIIPSSLDKVETAILAGALETVDRIGPCEANVRVEKIEDVRESKRRQVIDRAIDLIRNWEEGESLSYSELAEEVVKSVRGSTIKNYGHEGLPGGPDVEEADSIIIVEGRADVVNLLKYGIRNTIAVEGTSIPKTIIELSKSKTVTAFLDGDRGGDLILAELLQVADVDYVSRAPPSKEVEELKRKEVIKALRNKMPLEQLPEISLKARKPKKQLEKKKIIEEKAIKAPLPKKEEERIDLPEPLTDIVVQIEGTGESVLLDENFKEISRIPVRELVEKIQNIAEKIHAVVFDGVITQRIVDVAAEKDISILVGGTIGDVVKKPLKLRLYCANTTPKSFEDNLYR